MAHLSSCYFCGTALDEPLGTYGVGEETTVTLCPTCRRKLETVLGTAEGSLSQVDEPQPATVTAPDDDAAASGGEPGDGEADVAADRDPHADDEATDTPSADDDATATNDGAPADVDTAMGSERSEMGSETLEADLSDDEPTTADEFEAVEDAEDTAGGNVESGTSGVATDGEAGDDAVGEESPQVGLSTLEYNKVMRLLQNREFPVDRAEFEAVATNAYDLSQSDCAAVIDLAVDRGLLEETEGQLSRPE